MTLKHDASPRPADTIDDPVSWEPSRDFLKYSISALLIGALAFELLFWQVAPNDPGRGVGPMLGAAVAFTAWFFLWRRRTRLAVIVLAIGVWGVVTGAALFNGGVRAPIIVSYPLIIIFVGWLSGTRTAQKLAYLTVATTAAFVLAEYQGWLPPPAPTTLPLMYGVVQVLVATLALILISFLVRSYKTRLEDLRRVGADLARRTRALEATEAELQRAQAAAKVGSWIYDIASDSMRMSAEACRIFGVPDGTVGSYTSYLTRVPVQDRAALEVAWLSARQSGSFVHQHRILVGDDVRWVRHTAAMNMAVGGAVAWAEGTVQDVTQREATAEKLRLLANVFTHAREGIMITAADGAIIDVNAAFSRITGYPREEVLGRNPSMLASGRQGSAFYTALWSDLLGQGHWYGELWNRRKSGEVYAQMLTISAVRDATDCIVQYVALFSDITAIKAHESELEHIAHYDGLTGLPNRALLADRLHQCMAQAQRRGQRLAVVFFDLDGFKAINDQYGHGAGDQVLIHVAARMKHVLREGDTLARFGGDEFVALLLDLPDIKASVPMLARLLAAAAEPLLVGGHELRVSASLGVSFFPQARELDAEQLLRQADHAMYQAKLAGKNRYHAFDSGQETPVPA